MAGLWLAGGCLPAWLCDAQAQTTTFVTIAQTGQAGLTSISPNVSINDAGLVALAGQTPQGRTAHVGSGGGLTAVLAPSSGDAGSMVRDRVYINNLNKVLMLRGTFVIITDPVIWYDPFGIMPPWVVSPGSIDTLDFLQFWPATGGSPATIASVFVHQEYDFITYPPQKLTMFWSLGPDFCANNRGQVAFMANQGDDTVPANALFTVESPSSYVYLPLWSGARPVLADDGTIVVRSGPTASDPIVMLDYLMNTVQIVAGPSMGFRTMGLAPGISDDGRFIAFYGDLSAAAATNLNTVAGPGIFLSVPGVPDRKIIRVAGLASTNYPSDLTAFQPDMRVCVNTQSDPKGDIQVVFMATQTNRVGIFTSHYHDGWTGASIPVPLVMQGDCANGLGPFANFVLYDSLNTRGQIAFFAYGPANSVLVAQAPTCESCQCDAGSVESNLDSLSVKIGLGRATISGRPAYFRIYADYPSASLATPAGLEVHADSSFNLIYATNTFSPSNVLRQVKGPTVLADISQDTAYRFTVNFYNTSGTPNASGLYPPQGTPVSTVSVENPDGSGATNRLRVTRAGSGTWLYTFDPTSRGWELVSGFANALRKETVTGLTNGVIRTVTRTIRDLGDAVLSQTVSTYRSFPWGEELVQTIEDPAGLARTTTYTFYTNHVSDGPNYGHPRGIIYPEGRWEFFKEYAAGSVTKRVAQRLNNPYAESAVWPDPDNHSYESVQSGLLKMDMEYLKGHITSRRWRNQASAMDLWDCVATAPGVTNWNDPSNLITHTVTYGISDTNGASAGKTAKIFNPDGTAAMCSYFTEFIRDPFYAGTNTAPQIQTTRTVSLTGCPSSDGNTVIDGTRTEEVDDLYGNVISRTEYDIASGLLASSQITSARGGSGRATRIDYLDGTYITRAYDCCGLAAETDREGVTNSYSTAGTVILDLNGDGVPETYAGSSSTRAGVTTFTLVDAMGRTISTVLEGSDGKLIVQDQRGYDTLGRPAWTLDAMGRRTTYTNTTNGPFLLAITTYPDGSQSTQSSYQDGFLYESRGGAAPEVRYSYDLVQDKGVWVQTTKQTYLEKDGSLSPEYTAAYTDLAGRAYKTEYPWPDGSGPVVSGNEYNSQGQLVKTTEPDGIATLYAYNGRGELQTTALDVANPGVIDFGGADRITRNTSSVEHSALRGAVVRKTVTEVWETNGSPLSTISLTAEASVDGTRAWTTQYGLTTLAATTIDRARGQRTVTTWNPDGTSTLTVFQQGRQQSVTRYDANSNRVSQTTFAYDSFGRLATQTDARNGPTTYTYYDDGQLHSVTTPDPDTGASGLGEDPQTTSYTYYRDPVNGIKTVTTLPDGGLVMQQYFPSGQLKKTWGARTYPAEYTYDRAGRMATLTTWQRFDFATGMGVAASATTRWNYNARGLLANKRYADNKGPSYTYTAGGKLKTRLWARGILTTYGYDPHSGDLLTVTYSDATPSVAYTHDRAGRVASVTDAGGLHTLGYYHGRLAAESPGAGLFPGTSLVREYDSLDRLASLSLIAPAGAVYHVTYGYDVASRLQTVASGPDAVTYSYHPDSDLIRAVVYTHTNSVRLTTTKEYDKLGRIQSVTSAPAVGAPIGFSYDYNDADQRVRCTLANGEFWDYSYDGLGEVTNATKSLSVGVPIPGYGFGYQFDAIGSRTSSARETCWTSYAPNLLNQIQSVTCSPCLPIVGVVRSNATITVNGQAPIRTGPYFYSALQATGAWTTVSIQASVPGTGTNSLALAEESGRLFRENGTNPIKHDDDGNLIEDERWQYAWDAENRLVRMISKLPDVSVGLLVFDYDWQGRRIRKTTWRALSEGTTPVLDQRFLYDGWNLVALRDSRSYTTCSFTWGLDISGTLQAAGGVAGLLMVSDLAGGHHYPFCDGNGNVDAFVRAADSALSASYEYGPFGELLRATGPMAKANPFRFSTKYQDDETDLLYYGYRYYNASTGRWLFRDPLEENSTPNLYLFTANDPLDCVDPLGENFIAVGKRPLEPRLAGKFFSHMSIEYYKACPGPAEGTRFKPSDLGKGVFAGAKRADQFELYPTGAYKKARTFSIRLPEGKTFSRTFYIPVLPDGISFIHPTSDAADLVVIYADNGNVMDATTKWQKVSEAAQKYQYAEQLPIGKPLVNWPNSTYQLPPGNNSNTFVHQMAAAIGKRAAFFSDTPGAVTPSPVQDSDPAPVYHP